MKASELKRPTAEENQNIFNKYVIRNYTYGSIINDLCAVIQELELQTDEARENAKHFADKLEHADNYIKSIERHNKQLEERCSENESMENELD